MIYSNHSLSEIFALIGSTLTTCEVDYNNLKQAFDEHHLPKLDCARTYISVPVKDAEGNTCLDDDGEPETEMVFGGYNKKDPIYIEFRTLFKSLVLPAYIQIAKDVISDNVVYSPTMYCSDFFTNMNNDHPHKASLKTARDKVFNTVDQKFCRLLPKGAKQDSELAEHIARIITTIINLNDKARDSKKPNISDEDLNVAIKHLSIIK